MFFYMFLVLKYYYEFFKKGNISRGMSLIIALALSIVLLKSNTRGIHIAKENNNRKVIKLIKNIILNRKNLLINCYTSSLNSFIKYLNETFRN